VPARDAIATDRSPPVTAPALHEIALVPDRRHHEDRHDWIAFTKRLSLPLGADEIARELVEYLRQALRATSAAVYLVDPANAVYRLNAHVGDPPLAQVIVEASPLPSCLGRTTAPRPVPPRLLSRLGLPAVPAALVVPVRWRATLLGFVVVVGPSRASLPYGADDLERLATVTDQAAASIMAVQLSETRPAPASAPGERLTAALHDVKNAVSALSLLARNAATNFDDVEFQRDAMVTLSHTIARMQRVLAVLASPGLERRASSEPIDLQALILEATAPRAADPRVRLVRRLGAVRPVYGDRDALLRVIENLVTNAAEAIDGTGTITITLSEDPGHAVVSIADTGQGMSDEYRTRRLFAPFSSTKTGGWGVGLYQTKQAVESQHGEIVVDSALGRGTTFTVRLPLGPSLEPDAPASGR
jgi:signal transduction histidine kinase